MVWWRIHEECGSCVLIWSSQSIWIDWMILRIWNSPSIVPMIATLYSYRTHESHFTVLRRYGLEHPLLLLIRHAQQLQCRLGQRTQLLLPMDILTTLDWSTLNQNLQMLHVALEVQMPVSPSADTSLEVPQDLMYACSTCAYVTNTLSNLRRH